MSGTRPVMGPLEGTSEVAPFEFVAFVGDAQECTRYVAFPHLWAPEKARVRQPILIPSPFWGPPRMQGLHSNSAHLWAPEKAKVR